MFNFCTFQTDLSSNIYLLFIKYTVQANIESKSISLEKSKQGAFCLTFKGAICVTIKGGKHNLNIESEYGLNRTCLYSLQYIYLSLHTIQFTAHDQS